MCEGCQNKIKFRVELSQTQIFLSYLVDSTPPCERHFSINPHYVNQDYVFLNVELKLKTAFN